MISSVRQIHAVLGVIALLALLSPGSFASEPEESGDREMLIRGALIYKLAKFVEWPASDPGHDRSFVIGVLGDAAFADLIRRNVADLTIHDLPVDVRALKRPADVRDCQVVFIAPAARADLGAALAHMADAPVLTVGSQPDFLEAGGMINFVRYENMVRFVVNLSASQRAGLALDARLLKAAHTVERAP